MSSHEYPKNVAVIGAGVAGLVAARHLSDPACPCKLTLFEQTNSLGGTWVYSDMIGEDEYGLPVHSSMYKSLRTNLPKEVMMFPDFPHANKQGVSYLTAKEVLQYLNDYADHFNIKPNIKFRHYVKQISPLGSQWKIEVKDVEKNTEHVYVFDAVIIANGHNSKPRYPRVNGLEHFKGNQVHSHNYRDAVQFRDRKVLIIGAGPSGLDLTFEISSVTDNIVLSHHTDYAAKVGFPSKVVLKPDINRINRDGRVLFKDGTAMDFDDIVFATGYLYTYPFLSKECGIEVEDNYVSPLYKSIININHPTMGMLAVLKHTPTFYMVDIQVRFFIKCLLHPELLPNKKQMLAELKAFEERKIMEGVRKCDFHMLGEDNQLYMDDLFKIAGIPPIPPILLRMYFHGYNAIFSDFKSFRHNFYHIIDQENFTVVDLREIMTQPLEKLHSNPSACCGTLVPKHNA
ncbi:senecionine N-oxygenase-like [Cimex lectularius]|uniref:Flavin-containing monooxygenase n=1 Tax=Cimex lectularius TaxID=79782 RepID=A0A8I6RCC8_CIMLE|nr:senecionine N-oxygenase-like [Cimex lectularius]